MTETFNRPPIENADTSHEAETAASHLLGLLKQGAKLEPQLITQLIKALQQAEIAAATEVSDADLLQRASQVWDLDAWFTYDWRGQKVRLEELPSVEFRQRIDRMVASIIPDLELLSVHGKARGQEDDFSTVDIYKREPQTDLESVGKQAIENLPEPLRLLPFGFSLLEKFRGRYMVVADHPQNSEVVLGSYLICNPTSDRVGRPSDGGSFLAFGIKKSNKLLQLVAEGKLNPSGFVRALLHAGVVLDKNAQYILRIFFAGNKNLFLDPRNLRIVEYKDSTDAGEVNNHPNAEDYANRIKTYVPEYGIWTIGGLPGFHSSSYGNELRRFVYQGAEPRGR